MLEIKQEELSHQDAHSVLGDLRQAIKDKALNQLKRPGHAGHHLPACATSHDASRLNARIA